MFLGVLRVLVLVFFISSVVFHVRLALQPKTLSLLIFHFSFFLLNSSVTMLKRVAGIRFHLHGVFFDGQGT